MAKFLTKSGFSKILKSIMETGGVTPEMGDAMKRLIDDFDEREGMLRKYGEVYDGEDMDEYDYTENESDIDTLRENYAKLQKDYLDRFFGTKEIKDKVENIKDEQEEDIKRDGENQTFDDLLKDVEG